MVSSLLLIIQETITNATSAKTWLLQTLQADVSIFFSSSLKSASINKKDSLLVPDSGVCGSEALRGTVHERSQGARLWHRRSQHVRLLGLGRRTLLALVGHWPFHRPPCRLRQLREASRRRPLHRPSLLHRAPRIQRQNLCNRLFIWLPLCTLCLTCIYQMFRFFS